MKRNTEITLMATYVSQTGMSCLSTLIPLDGSYLCKLDSIENLRSGIFIKSLFDSLLYYEVSK